MYIKKLHKNLKLMTFNAKSKLIHSGPPWKAKLLQSFAKLTFLEFCWIPLSIVLTQLHRVLATNYRSDKPVSSKHSIVCTVRSWGQELCSIVCFGETVCSSSQFVLLTANMIQFQFLFLFQISWVRQTNADNSNRTAITFAFFRGVSFSFFCLISLEMFVSH